MAKFQSEKAYNGKPFVILLFIGFVVFAAVMMYGTKSIAEFFGPKMKANATREIQERLAKESQTPKESSN